MAISYAFRFQAIFITSASKVKILIAAGAVFMYKFHFKLFFDSRNMKCIDIKR